MKIAFEYVSNLWNKLVKKEQTAEREFEQFMKSWKKMDHKEIKQWKLSDYSDYFAGKKKIGGFLTKLINRIRK